MLRVATTYGYRPNPLGRALSTRRLQIIGVIVHDIRDSYFGDIIRGIEDATNSAGYLVVTCNSDRDRDRELAYLELLVAHRVSGVLFVSSGVDDPQHNAALSAQLQLLATNGGHAVAVASTRLLIPQVVPDNRGGARQIATHILSLGATPMLVLAGPPDLCTSEERLAGVADAFAAAGGEWDSRLVAYANFRQADARDAVTAALKNGTQFRAVLALSDMMAIGALEALESAGVHVPQDVVVSGFGNIPQTTLTRPRLTTVHVPTRELGQFGGEAILQAARTNGPLSLTPKVLATEIVVRDSTGG